MSKIVIPKDVSRLPVGSIVWPVVEGRYDGSPWVVNTGGVLLPFTVLPERADGFFPDDGEPAGAVAAQFAVITEGGGKLPTRGTVKRKTAQLPPPNLGALEKVTLGLNPEEFEDQDEWEDAKERELGNLKTCAAHTRVGHRVPWLDDRGIETETYDICMTPNQVRKLFGGKKGVKDAKRLGCGAFACAWQTGPDEVIKVTADADDVTAIKAGQGLKHVVKMREAVELNKAATGPDGDLHPVYAMRLEKLDPISEELGEVIESLPINMLIEEFREHYGAEYVDPHVADANYGLSPSTRMRAHDVSCSYTDMDEKACHKFVDEFLDTVEALGRRGVNWHDIHEGNFGMKGPVWKALDIGMSGTKERPDVPLLKGLGRPAGAKIKGTFCERTAKPRAHFDQRSFRWTEKNGNWILVGCPKGKWDAKRKTCKVGTRAHKVLSKKGPGDRCRRGRRVKK